MDWRLRWSCVALGTVGLLAMSTALPVETNAQGNDPGLLVTAYLNALNAHDVPSALALFDQYGSATDTRGHVFQGHAGLTQFLLANGFDSDMPERVNTDQLLVVGNRALWTYTCSCADAPIFVRVVTNQDRITVFAMSTAPAPAPVPTGTTRSGVLDWLVAFSILACVLTGTLGAHRHRPAPLTPRPAQGRLIAGLGRTLSERARRRSGP